MAIGDSNTIFILDLPEGHKLWRCNNGAGIPYSFITEADGFEIMSNVRNKELAMLRDFYQFNLRQHFDNRILCILARKGHKKKRHILRRNNNKKQPQKTPVEL